MATKGTISEKQVEAKLVKLCKDYQILTFKLLPFLCAGLPDRIVISRRGLYFVELKRPGGKLRPLQERMIAKLTDYGQTVHVLDNYEQVTNFINLIK